MAKCQFERTVRRSVSYEHGMRLNLWAKTKSKFAVGLFLFRNIRKSRHIISAPRVKVGNIILRSMMIDDEPEVQRIFFYLMGRYIPLPYVVPYRLAGSALVFVAAPIDEHGAESGIVGVNMFYFSKRNVVEGTVHEFFAGVLPKFQGRRTATNLRNFAKQHFKRNGIAGISTEILLSRVASLKSAENAGFRLVEILKNPHTGEESHRLFCDLN